MGLEFKALATSSGLSEESRRGIVEGCTGAAVEVLLGKTLGCDRYDEAAPPNIEGSRFFCSRI